jgi:N-acetylglucosamine kinase-like BadF-type ATPase
VEVVDPIAIGVDGGGTHLRVAVATRQGEVLGIGKAGSGNYHNVGAKQFQSNLELALSLAWEASQLPPRQADAVFLGLGGVTTEEDRVTIRSIVREVSLMSSDCIGVDHDLRIALMGGLAGDSGVVLIAGTGSSCYGRTTENRSWLAGGWGHVLDDLGSSYWLGLQAMIAATRDFDGRGQATCLRAQIAETLGLTNMRQIMRRVDMEGMSRSEIAALARLTTHAAEQGDPVARTIVSRGAAELASLVATVVAKLNLTASAAQIPVAVTGGLTNAGAIFMGPLENSIRERVPSAVLVKPKMPPVLGAVMLAIESLGDFDSSRVMSSLVGDHAAASQL